MRIESGSVAASSWYSQNTSFATDKGEDQSGVSRQTGPPAAETGKKKTSAGQQELTSDEKRVVSELKKRDQEVRAHEAAHMGAGGGIVRGGASFTYQSGPDGRRYAIGGEVGIDLSPVRDNPEATIRKMQQVRSAALAPANPSGQDRSVASAAAAQEAQARRQMTAEHSMGGDDGRASETQSERPSISSAGYGKQRSAAGEKNAEKHVPAVDLFA